MVPPRGLEVCVEKGLHVGGGGGEGGGGEGRGGGGTIDRFLWKQGKGLVFRV